MTKPNIEPIIFSPTEGFWNDNDGWGFCPTGATPQNELCEGEQVPFIGINDAVVVNLAQYSHIDYDEAVELLFNALSQYDGNKIATLVSSITGSTFTFKGNESWTINDSKATFDADHIQEILAEQTFIEDDDLCSLLNTHQTGIFYSDRDGGFYRHEPYL